MDLRRSTAMPDIGMPGKFLDGASVDAAVFGLRPDYRALVVAPAAQLS